MNINYFIERLDIFLNKSRKHSTIQIYDNKRMSIEVCFGITEFDENRIVLELPETYLIITGLDLKMRNYNKCGVEIKGDLHSISYETK